ncbi:hypothetical protein B0T26DRAFT_688260 [Lasiosphaeria miniovina]|uniref:Uncharacterized protein n=1 Tax=Lasiosphaeria miniovina TaxID=1954250 RepID=A0AA40EED5_9PEZI|nr:uncharacterized protein B0T26DRAFT_688260 [Lasiosphaeria miniovina]KAK0734376.1 hypothetical protein B0T26DRAFT_688260 [Lasiosphaeria miniovina]
MSGGLVLFETTESVIEVLWDIALAVFIVRIGFVYFAANFATGVALAWLASSSTTTATYLTQLTSTLPVWLLLATASVAAWTRLLVVRYEIPRAPGFRLAIGVAGLLFMAGADALVALVLLGQGTLAATLADARADAAAGLALALFALMPLVQMPLERAEGEELSHGHGHGHGKKSVVDAVPTVNVKERKEAKKTQ